MRREYSRVSEVELVRKVCPIAPCTYEYFTLREHKQGRLSEAEQYATTKTKPRFQAPRDRDIIRNTACSKAYSTALYC